MSSANVAPPTTPDLPSDQPWGQDLPPDITISWLNKMIDEGEAFLAAQPGWAKITPAIDTIMSEDDSSTFDMKSVLSATRTNRIAKVAEDNTAQLTDTKPFWDYSVANRRFEQHAAINSKLATFWYQTQNVDLVLADVIKYAQAAGTGYLHLAWDPELGDISATAEDPRNVIPIRPKRYDSLEYSTGVIVKRRVPVQYIKDRFGVEVAPDTDVPKGMFARTADSVVEMVSPIWADATKGQSQGSPGLPKIPSVWFYTCYLKDPRRNTKRDMGGRFRNRPVEMGTWEDFDPEIHGERPSSEAWQNAQGQWREPANNWSYLVKPGESLYPHRRMIQWAGGLKLYDGPCQTWAATRFFPVIKLTLIPYPWSWLGKAVIWDLLRLQISANKLLRIIDNHAAQVANPGAIVDKRNVSKSTADEFDTSRPGYKIRQDPMAGKGIQVVNPPPLGAEIPMHLKWILDEIDTLAGTKDLSGLLSLGQLPSNSTIEAIIQKMTPQLRMRSRILEAFHRNLATQLTYFFAQYYTFPMRVTILGPGGVTLDDFDYDPGSSIPDFLANSDYDSSGGITPEAFLRGPRPRYDRAREFLRALVYKIQPGSLLQSAQMERTLVYLQLARMGFMDPITLLEQLNVPNIGTDKLPDNVRSVLDRLAWCQQVGLTASVNAAGRKATGQEPPQVRPDGKVSESG